MDDVLNLNSIPLSENYSETRYEAMSQIRYPLNIAQCRNCGHVQLTDIIDTKLLWNSYTYFTSNSHGMYDHFVEIARETKEFIFEGSFTNQFAIDIGSNDGTFLQIAKNRGAKVLGVDPAIDVAKYANSQGIPTIISVLNPETTNAIIAEYGQADLVTAFNVFAHTDDLQNFVGLLHRLLKPGGLFVFEAQYLRDIIQKNLIATFFHEHMSHHSLLPLSSFLNSLGLQLFHALEYESQQGSIVGFCIKSNNPIERSDKLNLLLALEDSENLNSLESMTSLRVRFEKNKIAVSQFLETRKQSGYRILGYGASRSGPTLIIQFELDNKIDYVVDDDTKKHGKFETGAGFEILPSETLLDYPKTVAIILAWVHAEKIIEDNIAFIKAGGEFLVLSPDPRIISQNGVELLVS